MASQLLYSMPRGDSRSLPVSVPIGTYTTGATIYFALKSTIDNDLTDNTALLKKTITDADIVNTTSTSVNYIFKINPSDTNNIPPGKYRAEFEFVSADKQTVITFPDPYKTEWYWQITGEVNRRIS